MKALSLWQGLLDQSGGEEGGEPSNPLPPFAVISTWRVRMLMPANAVYRGLQVDLSETVTFVRFVVRSVPVDHDATCAVGSMNERKIQH